MMRYLTGLVLLFVSAALAARPPAAPRGQPDPDAGLIAPLQASLIGNDHWQEGLKGLKELAARNPQLIQAKLKSEFLNLMLRRHLYDDIESLAIQGIMGNHSNSEGCDKMQFCRVKALLEAGKNEQALSAAKAYYNVCMSQEANMAIQLFGEALEKARGDKEPGIVIRFKLQQAEGAKLPNDTSLPATLPSDLGENVLKEVKVQPPAELEAWLKNYPTMADTFLNRQAHGNVLLLTDRVVEAEMEFERAMQLRNSTDLRSAVQNIARVSRRGHDGRTRERVCPSPSRGCAVFHTTIGRHPVGIEHAGLMDEEEPGRGGAGRDE